MSFTGKVVKCDKKPFNTFASGSLDAFGGANFADFYWETALLVRESVRDHAAATDFAELAAAHEGLERGGHAVVLFFEPLTHFIKQRPV